MSLKRILAKLYADFFGYFWLPCPICGKFFGGHECRGSVQCELRSHSSHATCCVPNDQIVINSDACERAHERQMLIDTP